MSSDTYAQLVQATTDATRTLELIAHLALSSGKGLQFSTLVRQVADRLTEAQEAVDDHYYAQTT